MVDLAGKVAIVTGAGSGIGRACAVAFGAAGAAVVANDLAPDGLETTLADVEAAGRAGARGGHRKQGPCLLPGWLRWRGEATGAEAARSRRGRSTRRCCGAIAPA